MKQGWSMYLHEDREEFKDIIKEGVVDTHGKRDNA